MKLLRKLCSQEVNILLDRMESHPEEFYQSVSLSASILGGKWDLLLTAGEFTRIEKFLLRRNMRKLKRMATHRLIITTLVDEPVNRDYGMLSDPYIMSTVGRYTNSTSDQSITIASQEQFK